MIQEFIVLRMRIDREECIKQSESEFSKTDERIMSKNHRREKARDQDD
jgi:hypothetical protein